MCVGGGGGGIDSLKTDGGIEAELGRRSAE